MIYTQKQIANIREVYEPSGHNISTARGILREQYGFSPSEPIMRKYWKPLGYTPIRGGLHVGKDDRRYHSSQVEGGTRRRFFDALRLRGESLGPLNIQDLAREFGIPQKMAGELLKAFRAQSINKDQKLEERISTP